MTTHKCLLALLMALGSPSVHAQLTEDYSFSPGLAVPDANATGVSDVRNITTSSITAIGSLTVDLSISGDYNGDLYLYLRHQIGNLVDGFAVLLNRTGRTSGNPIGYDDSGFAITLADTATGDIHTYRNTVVPAAGQPLNGTWQPDGRNIDPATVLDTDPRSSPLSNFNNLGINGTWTLFAADLNTGGTSQIDSWALHFIAVPEPRHFSLVVAVALLSFAWWRRTWRRTRRRGSSGS